MSFPTFKSHMNQVNPKVKYIKLRLHFCCLGNFKGQSIKGKREGHWKKPILATSHLWILLCHWHRQLGLPDKECDVKIDGEAHLGLQEHRREWLLEAGVDGPGRGCWSGAGSFSMWVSVACGTLWSSRKWPELERQGSFWCGPCALILGHREVEKGEPGVHRRHPEQQTFRKTSKVVFGGMRFIWGYGRRAREKEEQDTWSVALFKKMHFIRV